MENFLQGLNNVCIYFDDILVSGKTTEDDVHHLETVLHRLQAGPHLKHSKCLFVLTSGAHLGFQISANLQPTSKKIQVVKDSLFQLISLS